MKTKSISISQIRDLSQACEMAEAWRGNRDPDTYDEFDAWIRSVRKAIRIVKRDRIRLRKLEAAMRGRIRQASLGVDLTDEQVETALEYALNHE